MRNQCIQSFVSPLSLFSLTQRSGCIIKYGAVRKFSRLLSSVWRCLTCGAVPCTICQTTGGACCLAGVCRTQFTRIPPFPPSEASPSVLHQESSASFIFIRFVLHSATRMIQLRFHRFQIDRSLQNSSRSFVELPRHNTNAFLASYFPILSNLPYIFTPHRQNKNDGMLRRKQQSKNDIIGDW